MVNLSRQRLFLWAALSAAALGLLVAAPAGAQDARQITITNVDSSSAPTIELTVFGLDGSGTPIDFTSTPLEVRHNGELIGADRVEILPDAASIGTVALFLVDLPPGVGGDIPAVQDAIKQYAAPPYMEELVDYTALYRVGAAGATPVLPAAEFYNSVANQFQTPLPTESGATALYDSVGGLLQSIEAQKPAGVTTLPVMIVISDGTDTVSSSFEADEVAAAAVAAGVPVHTIWLDNPDVGASKDEGRSFLQTLAAQTGGSSAELDAPEQLTAIWESIASRGKQSLIRYTLDSVTGGDYSVSVSLLNDPSVSGEATVSIPPGAPSVVLDLPPESRTLTLVNLDAPLENIRLSTTVQWVDGVERTITRAELVVNGLVVGEIDPETLDAFDPRISSANNYIFGANRVQVFVVDDAGGQAKSGEVVLTIVQGEETVIPEAIQPSIWERYRTALTWVGGCLVTLVMGVLLFAAYYFIRRSSLLRSLGLSNLLFRIPFLRPYLREMGAVERAVSQGKRFQRVARKTGDQASRYKADVGSAGEERPGGAGRPNPYLELISATTPVGQRLELTEVEVRLGRSPKQADLAFKDDITMSRIHATIVKEGNDYRLFDEQSTSGSFVNEQRVPDYGIQLIDRDEIRLGGVKLRFRQP